MRSATGPLSTAVIGQVLRDARRSRGLTQHQLAKPFSTAFVSSVELGNTMPSLPSLAILLRHMGITMAEFFSEVERRADEVARAAAE
jgi:transcriptional regulator with XRE-family HTH domain